MKGATKAISNIEHYGFYLFASIINWEQNLTLLISLTNKNMCIRMACWPFPKMYHQKSKLGHTNLGINNNASWISEFQIEKMTTHPVLLLENACYSPIQEAFFWESLF